jgi:hypothetical protein
MQCIAEMWKIQHPAEDVWWACTGTIHQRIRLAQQHPVAETPVVYPLLPDLIQNNIQIPVVSTKPYTKEAVHAHSPPLSSTIFFAGTLADSSRRRGATGQWVHWLMSPGSEPMRWKLSPTRALSWHVSS